MYRDSLSPTPHDNVTDLYAYFILHNKLYVFNLCLLFVINVILTVYLNVSTTTLT